MTTIAIRRDILGGVQRSTAGDSGLVIPVALRLTRAENAALLRIALRTGESRSDILRRFVRKGLTLGM